MTLTDIELHVWQAISCARLNYASEKDIQDLLEPVLRQLFTGVAREHRLTARDIPDFAIAEDALRVWAVEVKVRGSASTILRQLKRYNDHPSVLGTLLVSVRPLRGMPETLSGKPVAQLNIFANCV